MLVPKNFNPNITHHFYFIRHGIYKGIQYFAPQLQGKMLDFGCGAKPYKSLFKHVSQYIGVDYASEGHAHDNEQIEFFYNGKTLPFENQTFDSVLSTEVFEHIFELDAILQELNRVLKPNATLLATMPFAWNEHEVPIDYARYTSFGITAALQRNGFEVIELKKSGNFVEALFQLFILYVHTHWISKLPAIPFFKGAMRRLICTMLNLKGIIFSAILPKKYDFYLSNIVLAKKIN